MSQDSLLPYQDPADVDDGILEEQDAYERAQMRTLEADAGWREAHVKRENQRMDLRQKAYEHAVAVCLGLAFYLFAMAFIVTAQEKGQFSGEAQIAIFATPIIAIAAITIFILRGVFSGFSEKSFAEDTQILSQFTNGQGH